MTTPDHYFPDDAEQKRTITELVINMRAHGDQQGIVSVMGVTYSYDLQTGSVELIKETRQGEVINYYTDPAFEKPINNIKEAIAYIAKIELLKRHGHDLPPDNLNLEQIDRALRDIRRPSSAWTSQAVLFGPNPTNDPFFRIRCLDDVDKIKPMQEQLHRPTQ